MDAIGIKQIRTLCSNTSGSARTLSTLANGKGRGVPSQLPGSTDLEAICRRCGFFSHAHLDLQGLVALWREGLLVCKVLHGQACGHIWHQSRCHRNQKSRCATRLRFYGQTFLARNRFCAVPAHSGDGLYLKGITRGFSMGSPSPRAMVAEPRVLPTILKSVSFLRFLSLHGEGGRLPAPHAPEPFLPHLQPRASCSASRA